MIKIKWSLYFLRTFARNVSLSSISWFQIFDLLIFISSISWLHFFNLQNSVLQSPNFISDSSFTSIPCYSSPKTIWAFHIYKWRDLHKQFITIPWEKIKTSSTKVGQYASTMALLMRVLYGKYWFSAFTLSAFLLWVLSLSFGTIRHLFKNNKCI